MDADDKGPGPKGANTKRKNLKQDIQEAILSRRSGKYTSDPDDKTRGIFKDPDKEVQREYRKSLTQKIREMKAQR